MKLNYCIIFLSFLSVSCSKDAISNETEEIDPGEITTSLNSASTDWGLSESRLRDYMKGYNEINSYQSDLLLFDSKSKHTISYNMIDGCLAATSIIFPMGQADIDISKMLDGYSFIGELGGGKVYSNTSKNNIATVWTPVANDSAYSAIGFVPLKSDVFEDLEIRVFTNNEIKVDGFTAQASGTVSNIDSDVEVGFIYDTTENLSEISGKKVSKTGAGDFSLNLDGLIDDAQYYYRAYACVDGFYYFGEIRQFQTEAISYSINGRSFKMIKVESDGLPAFSMMQTELLPNENFVIGGVSIGTLNENGDVGVIKTEFRTFLNNLREKTGIPFRLPTTEEWQLAAKGGEKSNRYNYSGSEKIDEVAWYSGNSGKKLHDPALKDANELGFYDMSGNYSEVCNDSDDLYYIDGNTCGGNWTSTASGCKVNSFEKGKTSGKIPNSRLKEKNAFDARYHTIRLVYSRQ